jgi:hypothetical protein
MHKPHLVMIVTGLGGMLALTLMMQHLLSRQAETKAEGLVAEAFAAKFGKLLEQPPLLFVREPSDELAEGIAVVAKVRPKPDTDVDLMLSDMGAFLWSLQFEEGTPSTITIRYRDTLTRESYNHNVPRPSQKAPKTAPKAAATPPKSAATPPKPAATPPASGR